MMVRSCATKKLFFENLNEQTLALLTSQVTKLPQSICRILCRPNSAIVISVSKRRQSFYMFRRAYLFQLRIYV